MRLSEVINNSDGELISEGEFTTLNYCTAQSKVTFLTFLENPKYLEQLTTNRFISCVLCTGELIKHLPNKTYGVFLTKEPKVTFYSIHNSLIGNPEYNLPLYKTSIGENCDINPLAYISPHNVTIGKNVKIGEFVSINENTIIGNNCIIHPGTIIGVFL